MGYFPAFIEFENKKILVVGGGYIAYEKLEKLIDFTHNITIIATKLSENVAKIAKEYDIVVIQRPYMVGDIEGFDIVIVATDTIELHKEIYIESRSSRVLVNSVDNTKYCDFIFPSYIKRGDLTIAFSTSGTSPAFAKHIRRYFENIIPDGIEEFLKHMKELRSTLPKGKKRMQIFDKMAKEFIDKHFGKNS